MALIKCYEYSKEISDMAESCPHCGVGKAIECHECSNKHSVSLKSCPNCGYRCGDHKRWINIKSFFLAYPILTALFYLYWNLVEFDIDFELILINIILALIHIIWFVLIYSSRKMKGNTLSLEKSVEIKEEVTIENPVRKSRLIKTKLQARTLAVVIFFVSLLIYLLITAGSGDREGNKNFGYIALFVTVLIYRMFLKPEDKGDQ